MKCRADKDGLIGKTDYIRAGEVFEAKRCPSWASPVAVPPKKKETGEDMPPADEGDGK